MPDAQSLIKQVAAAANNQANALVGNWLPNGRMESGEYTALNPTRADSTLGSFKINLQTGKWQDFATGDKGGDLVSLYAYLNDCKQMEAAREVGKQVGIDVDAETERTHLQSKSKFKANNVGTWIYHRRRPDLPGAYEPYLMVKRWEPGFNDRPKSFSQHCAKTGISTKKRKLDTPYPLYGLEYIDRGLPQSTIFVVVEGEKCQAAMQDALNAAMNRKPQRGAFNYAVATTWSGGGKAIEKTDWTPLANKLVILVPDNDTAGRKTAADIGKKILGASTMADRENYVLIADIHKGAQEKADIYDLWHSPDRDPELDVIDLLLRATSLDEGGIRPLARVHEFGLHVEALMEHERKGEKDRMEKPPSPAPTLESHLNSGDPYEVFGFETVRESNSIKILYIFYLKRTGKILKYTASQLHQIAFLNEIANIEYWRGLANDDNIKKYIPDWAARLIQLCTERGECNVALAMHGCGVYPGDGGLLIHNGDAVYDTAKNDWHDPHELSTPKRIFQKEKQLSPFSRLDLTDRTVFDKTERAVKYFLNAVESLPWRMSIMGEILAGWTMLAPLCGALKWRSHFFLIGGAGLGKSSIIRDVIGPALGDRRKLVSGASTTEPGIRRTIGNHALPLLRDEAQNFETDKRRNANHQAILQLMRSASTEEADGAITHGDGNVYRVRTMALFAAINSGITEPADRARFFICALERNKAETAADYKRRWAHIQTEMSKADPADQPLCESLFWFAIDRLDKILADADVVTDAIIQNLPRAGVRNAAHLATAVAAYHQMRRGWEAYTDDDLREWVKYSIGGIRRFIDSIEEGSRGDNFFLLFLSMKVRMGSHWEPRIDDLVALAATRSSRYDQVDAFGKPDDDITRAREALQSIGVRIVFPKNDDDNPHLWLASIDDNLDKLLAGTPWANAHARKEFLLNNGAKPSRQIGKTGTTRHGVMIRLGEILDIGGEPEEFIHGEGDEEGGEQEMETTT